MENYRVLSVIGEGTYGKVYKAQERETGRVVAIKKFKQNEEDDPHVKKTMMREIRLLKEYRHNNIVNLRRVFRQHGKLFLIFDYVEKTLLEELQESPQGIKPERIKEIIFQILSACQYLHSNGIIHRDIKPENLLITHNGVVKICDFGFARNMRKERNYQYTDYVSTRWYRAPELLVGDAAYNETVDIWAIGCIFAEIYNGMPLFPGESDLHTLQLILETISADDMENNKEVQELSKQQRVAFKLNPMYDGMKVPIAKETIQNEEHLKEVSLTALLQGMDKASLDFLRQTLLIDGRQRVNAEQLLKHEYFEGDFKDQYIAQFDSLVLKDTEQDEKLAQTTLTCKDGRDEIPLEELFSSSDVEDDEEKEEEESELGQDQNESSEKQQEASQQSLTIQQVRQNSQEVKTESVIGQPVLNSGSNCTNKAIKSELNPETSVSQKKQSSNKGSKGKSVNQSLQNEIQEQVSRENSVLKSQEKSNLKKVINTQTRDLKTEADQALSTVNTVEMSEEHMQLTSSRMWKQVPTTQFKVDQLNDENKVTLGHQSKSKQESPKAIENSKRYFQKGEHKNSPIDQSSIESENSKTPDQKKYTQLYPSDLSQTKHTVLALENHNRNSTQFKKVSQNNSVNKVSKVNITFNNQNGSNKMSMKNFQTFQNSQLGIPQSNQQKNLKAESSISFLDSSNQNLYESGPKYAQFKGYTKHPNLQQSVKLQLHQTTRDFTPQKIQFMQNKLNQLNQKDTQDSSFSLPRNEKNLNSITEQSVEANAFKVIPQYAQTSTIMDYKPVLNNLNNNKTQSQENIETLKRDKLPNVKGKYSLIEDQLIYAQDVYPQSKNASTHELQQYKLPMHNKNRQQQAVQSQSNIPNSQLKTTFQQLQLANAQKPDLAQFQDPVRRALNNPEPMKIISLPKLPQNFQQNPKFRKQNAHTDMARPNEAYIAITKPDRSTSLLENQSKRYVNLSQQTQETLKQQSNYNLFNQSVYVDSKLSEPQSYNQQKHVNSNPKQQKHYLDQSPPVEQNQKVSLTTKKAYNKNTKFIQTQLTQKQKHSHSIGPLANVQQVINETEQSSGMFSKSQVDPSSSMMSQMQNNKFQNTNFDKDFFPKRNITTKLRNAQILQSKKKMNYDQYGQQYKHKEIVVLPNLKQQVKPKQINFVQNNSVSPQKHNKDELHSILRKGNITQTNSQVELQGIYSNSKLSQFQMYMSPNKDYGSQNLIKQLSSSKIQSEMQLTKLNYRGHIERQNGINHQEFKTKTESNWVQINNNNNKQVVGQNSNSQPPLKQVNFPLAGIGPSPIQISPGKTNKKVSKVVMHGVRQV